MSSQAGIPVSFRVHADKHPDLYAWLANLEPGSRSHAMRDAMERGIGSKTLGQYGGTIEDIQEMVLAVHNQLIEETTRLIMTNIEELIVNAVHRTVRAAVADALQGAQAPSTNEPTYLVSGTSEADAALRQQFKGMGRSRR